MIVVKEKEKEKKSNLKFEHLKNDITMANLVRTRMEIGHDFSSWNPLNASQIIFEKAGELIFNYKAIRIQLRKISGFLVNFFEIAPNTRFLIVNGSPIRKDPNSISELNTLLSKFNSMILLRWMPGMLSNRFIVYRFWEERKFERIRNRVRNRWDRALYDSAMNFNWIPDLAILLSITGEFEIMSKELLDFRIPTIGVIDTNADPSSVMYPFHGNDDHTLGSLFYLSIFKNCINFGKKLAREFRMNLFRSKKEFLKKKLELKIMKAKKQKRLFLLLKKYLKKFKLCGFTKAELRQIERRRLWLERKKKEEERERYLKGDIDPEMMEFYKRLIYMYNYLEMLDQENFELSELSLASLLVYRDGNKYQTKGIHSIVVKRTWKKYIYMLKTKVQKK